MRTLEGSRSVSASRKRDGADIFCRRSVARARDECSAFYRPTSGWSCQATGASTRGATGTLVPAAGGSTAITGEEIDQPFGDLSLPGQRSIIFAIYSTETL